MLSRKAVAEPQSSTGLSREWQCNIDLGGKGAQSVTEIGVHLSALIITRRAKTVEIGPIPMYPEQPL